MLRKPNAIASRCVYIRCAILSAENYALSYEVPVVILVGKFHDGGVEAEGTHQVRIVHGDRPLQLRCARSFPFMVSLLGWVMQLERVNYPRSWVGPPSLSRAS